MHTGWVPLPPIPSGTPAEETAIHDSIVEHDGEAPAYEAVIHEPTSDPTEETLAEKAATHDSIAEHVGEAPEETAHEPTADLAQETLAPHEPLLHSAGDETATREHPEESLVIFIVCPLPKHNRQSCI